MKGAHVKARGFDRQRVLLGISAIMAAFLLVGASLLAMAPANACDVETCGLYVGKAYGSSSFGSAALGPVAIDPKDSDLETFGLPVPDDLQEGEAEAVSSDGEDAAASESAYAHAVRGTEELLQYPAGLPAGCEPVSLTLALRSLGFDIAPEELIENYLSMDATWSDVSSYMGSPYVSGGAFPPAIVDAANACSKAQGSSLFAVDASGATFEELRTLAAQGSPVLIWSTIGRGHPSFSGQYVDGYAWYSNEHCVLMYGAEGDQVLVSDPIAGLTSEGAEHFGSIFEECGSYAVCFMEG